MEEVRLIIGDDEFKKSQRMWETCLLDEKAPNPSPQLTAPALYHACMEVRGQTDTRSPGRRLMAEFKRRKAQAVGAGSRAAAPPQPKPSAAPREQAPREQAPTAKSQNVTSPSDGLSGKKILEKLRRLYCPLEKVESERSALLEFAECYDTPNGRAVRDAELRRLSREHEALTRAAYDFRQQHRRESTIVQEWNSK